MLTVALCHLSMDVCWLPPNDVEERRVDNVFPQSDIGGNRTGTQERRLGVWPKEWTWTTWSCPTGRSSVLPSQKDGGRVVAEGGDLR